MWGWGGWEEWRLQKPGSRCWQLGWPDACAVNRAPARDGVVSACRGGGKGFEKDLQGVHGHADRSNKSQALVGEVKIILLISWLISFVGVGARCLW